MIKKNFVGGVFGIVASVTVLAALVMPASAVTGGSSEAPLLKQAAEEADVIATAQCTGIELKGTVRKKIKKWPDHSAE